MSNNPGFVAPHPIKKTVHQKSHHKRGRRAGRYFHELSYDLQKGESGKIPKNETMQIAGSQTLLNAIDAVRSGGKIVGVSWFGQPLEVDIDTLRERSLRYLFPDISTLEHLEFTVRLVASGRVRLKPAITHVLDGIESVPQAFEITANKGKYQAINPAQVKMC